MGFFDKVFASANVAVAKPIINNQQEAFLTTVVASASADGDIEGSEWDTIYNTLYQKKMFREIMDTWALIEECKVNIKGYDSLANAVTECASHIKQENRDMLFTVCVDIVLIDGSLSSGEQAIIEHLKTELNISDDFAMKTIEVMLIRNKGNA